jgi:hypothetical protein
MPDKRIVRQWACAAAVLLAVLSGAIAHYKAISSQQKRLDSARRDLTRLREQNGGTPQSRAELDQTRQALTRFAKEVSGEIDLGALLQPLEQDLKDSAAPGREITTRSTTPGPQLTRTALSLRFRGSFERMFSFARRLENSGMPIRIDTIAAERPSGEYGGQLQVEIEFSTFSSTSEELTRWATAE